MGDPPYGNEPIIRSLCFSWSTDIYFTVRKIGNIQTFKKNEIITK